MAEIRPIKMTPEMVARHRASAKERTQSADGALFTPSGGFEITDFQDCNFLRTKFNARTNLCCLA